MRFSPLKFALSIGVGALAAWFIWHTWRNSRTGLEFAGSVDDRDTEQILARLAPRGDAWVQDDGRAAHLERWPLDEATVRDLFPVVTQTPLLVFDARTYYRLRPNIDESYEMADHPNGHWTRRTNAQGWREDHDYVAKPGRALVVVAGDSHTEGTCDDADSFANLVEAALRAEGRDVEVLNTGTMTYSFYHYLAVLEALVEEHPRVFVTVAYGGNDFLEVLTPHHHFQRGRTPQLPREVWNDVGRAHFSTEAFAQGFLQAAVFQRFPDQIPVSLEAAEAIYAEIRAICAEHGIEWISAQIPSAFATHQHGLDALKARAAEVLGVHDDDLEVETRLTDALFRAERESGVEPIDLRTVLVPEEGPWYLSDYHINPRAHRRIADVLLPIVRAALDRTAR